MDIALGITHKYWEVQEITAYLMGMKTNYVKVQQ